MGKPIRNFTASASCLIIAIATTAIPTPEERAERVQRREAELAALEAQQALERLREDACGEAKMSHTYFANGGDVVNVNSARTELGDTVLVFDESFYPGKYSRQSVIAFVGLKGDTACDMKTVWSDRLGDPAQIYDQRLLKLYRELIGGVEGKSPSSYRSRRYP